MKPIDVHLGCETLKAAPKTVEGAIVTAGDKQYYKITNYDVMPPFLMNIVSNTDLWMFISSTGALTAGRTSPDTALFPYYTDDKIHDAHGITGSKTVLLVHKNDRQYLWEPFSAQYEGVYAVQRNLYKNSSSSELMFEEINVDLEVRFTYSWRNCDRFGFIRTSTLFNDSGEPLSVGIVDGIQNILPAGVDQRMQQEYSTLVDGYKKNELQTDTGLGLFTLSSVPIDKAEPAESLRATVAWSAGPDHASILLSAAQLGRFRRGLPVSEETQVRGRRGAYFLHTNIELTAGGREAWVIAADVGKDHAAVADLSELLLSQPDISPLIEREVGSDNEELQGLIGRADGIQQTSDVLNMFRHCSNTLFNIMRGGVFPDNYMISSDDLRSFIRTANTAAWTASQDLTASLPDRITLPALKERAAGAGPDIERLIHEYLPLTFSRRHGDPSRPWNRFSINVKDENGSRKLDFEGNWRDIFQNWEALALSYPEFIESMISKFLNASTADGYNPYRLCRNGFDWEVLDPADPWSYIGYWGDHQIIYLLKLLELSRRYHPETLPALLARDIFVYAHVPYTIKSWDEIWRDPHRSVNFDAARDADIRKRMNTVGTDAQLVRDRDGGICYVNLMEKLLVPLLVKLSNFVPEAGIWMNTQRPEWNDANNALAGYGASVVTVCYIRRFIMFCLDLFADMRDSSVNISNNVFRLFSEIRDVFASHEHLLDGTISDADRAAIASGLGQAGSDHRRRVYTERTGAARNALGVNDGITFLQSALRYIDHTIAANKRNDDLYHSYNLLDISRREEIGIHHLYEMLEGQVAVLSSGYLSLEDSVLMLNSLRNSALYREDQSSYLLYPDRELPRFIEKNVIPEEAVKRSALLQKYLKDHDRRIIYRDASGTCRFHYSFMNARLLEQSLKAMKAGDPAVTDAEITRILDIYESVFTHTFYTGRSCTFFKYEGLGCIYWHMVSKLLLAVQDTVNRAVHAGVHSSVTERLAVCYHEIKYGIGSHKRPDVYGAFPTDPYSHTPAHSGVQQPGLTGQVKEDIISRFGELGLSVSDGRIEFTTVLLKRDEFLSRSHSFFYYDVNNKKQSMMLSRDMLAFTFCQVPIIYIISPEKKVIVTLQDGSEKEMKGSGIDAALSRSIFQRDNKVKLIRVMLGGER